MSTCGKCIAVFSVRKQLLSSCFPDAFSNVAQRNSSRKLSFLTGFKHVLSTRSPSSAAAKHRSQPVIPSQCSNGKSAVRCISSSAKKDMRFVQFVIPQGKSLNAPRRLGALLPGHDGHEDVVVDISGVDHSIPNDMIAFLKAFPEKLKKAKRVVAEGRSILGLSQVKLLPPVINPDKVACVGLNYKDHCEEQKVAFPKAPVFFSKWSSCLIGPYEKITYPSITKNLDWEVEVAIIMGRKAKDISPSAALDYVFGLSVAQDITARDWQGKGPGSRNAGQWLLAKATDRSCPIGPAVVQLSSISDINSMPMRCYVNGELKQEGNTSNMIHSFEEIIAFLSHCCTLLPGDVILTGTPAGVGVFRNPPEFLNVGDVIESEVVGLGKLKNTIV